MKTTGILLLLNYLWIIIMKFPNGFQNCNIYGLYPQNKFSLYFQVSFHLILTSPSFFLTYPKLNKFKHIFGLVLTISFSLLNLSEVDHNISVFTIPCSFCFFYLWPGWKFWLLSWAAEGTSSLWRCNDQTDFARCGQQLALCLQQGCC